MATVIHFHCGWCDDIETCDCVCSRCSAAKQAAAEKAAVAKPTCGAVGGAASSQPEPWQCWNCGAYGDEYCRRGCLEERVGIRNAAAAAEKRKADAAMKKKDCTCEDDNANMCEFCHWEEDNRCRGCGSYPDEACNSKCDGDVHEICEGCGRVGDCWCDDGYSYRSERSAHSCRSSD